MGTNSANNNSTALKKSRSGWLIVGGVAAVVALIVFLGGVFVSGAMATSGRSGLFNRQPGERPEFQIQPASELPTAAPSVRGVVTQRADNTLTVVERGGFGRGEQGNQAQGSTAPQVMVVVTNATTLYHDITQMNLNQGAPSGTIQQKVEPGSLAGISANSRVTVWGDQSGNQLTAKVLVYTDPMNFRQQ